MVNQQVNNPESGLRDQRVEYIRESNVGSTPTDPTIEKYSSVVTNVNWSSDAVNEPQRGLGSADPQDFIRGPETHEVTVAYDLMQWFTDGSGNAQDAAYDGMARDSDNLLPNSHTVLVREDKGSVLAENTVSGSTSYSTRLYTVAKGALVDEVSVSGDPSDSQPVSVELSYVAQKARTYQIDQPDSDTEFTVSSDDSGDTNQTITIEGQDGSGSFQTEDLSLNGTTVVSTTNVYSSLDAAYLDSETAGTVTVSINSGTTSSPTEGDALMKIEGSSTYNGVEGDLGVPGKGSGGTRSSAPTGTETFLGDTIARKSDPVPHEIQSMTLTVANNIETTERAEALGSAVFPGNREVTAEATMFGETTTHDMLTEHLQNNKQSLDWKMDGGTVTVDNSVLTDPGERAAEEGQAVMTTDNTFMGEGISFS